MASIVISVTVVDVISRSATEMLASCFPHTLSMTSRAGGVSMADGISKLATEMLA